MIPRIHKAHWLGMVWDKANRGRQAIWPSEHMIRFVARTYGDRPDRSSIRFLDIGSGRHAPNTHALTMMGYDATAIDFAPGAMAHERADIRASMLFGPETFDCVLDINTLCHVENPPFKEIHAWLKPGGIFFSIWPAFDSQLDLNGKGFCHLLNGVEIHNMLSMFDALGVRVGHAEYCEPNSIRRHTSWLIMAHK